MAVTAGILNGTDLLVYDNTHPIAHSQSCSIHLSMDMRDTSTKASAGWKSILPGTRSWNVEVSGLIALDSTYNYAYLMALITAKTRVVLKFRTANTDDFYYYGYAYLSSVGAEAPNQGNTTYSGSFTGDGVLTLQMGAGGDVITDYGDDFTITGNDTMITISGTTPVTGTIISIADLPTTNPITIKNNSSESATILEEDGKLIDGNASVDVAPNDYITIYPNGTKFEATGVFTPTAI